MKNGGGMAKDGVDALPAAGLNRPAPRGDINRFVGHHLYLVQQAPYNNGHFTTNKGSGGPTAACPLV
jgi:hypothetical protein